MASHLKIGNNQCMVGKLLILLEILSVTQSASVSDIKATSKPSVEKSTLSPDSKEIVCPPQSAYYNDTSSCYKLMEQGPCGDLQVFYPLDKDSKYGDCGCISNPNGCSYNVKSHRMVLPSLDFKQCFWAYTQGPCKSDEWYVLDTPTLKPQCQQNPCLSADKSTGDIIKKPTSENDLFTFRFNDTCYTTFTQGFCPTGKYVQFIGTNDPYPKCINVKFGPPKCLFGVGPVVGMPCEAGYKQVGEDCVLANLEFE